MKQKWHRRFIHLANQIASWSPDRSTKVGVVIVDQETKDILSTGYNGFVPGFEPNEEDHERPRKYEVTEHAERNAILGAQRRGVSLVGATMYQNWAPTACADCARAIVRAGIKRMVGFNRPFGGKGAGTHYDIQGSAERILDAGGVERLVLDEDYYKDIT